MARHCLIASWFLLLTHISFCQQSGNYIEDSVDLLHVREMEIAFVNSEKFARPITFRFKSLTIEDVRFDTNKNR